MSSSHARQQFQQILQAPTFDLAEAALYIAQDEYPELEVDAYLNALDTMADEVRERLPDVDYPLRVIQTLNRYLFDDLGYTGNQQHYYDPRNSFLNDVIDRRTGIPITLSLLYLEIARRIDFPMVGINFPGHFLIRPHREDTDFHIDPFHGGEVLFVQDCQDRLRQIYGQPVNLQARFMDTITPPQFLTRLLSNLKQIYLNHKQRSKCLTVSDYLLLIHPQSPELRDRGVLHYQMGHWDAAKQDLWAYLDTYPLAEDRTLINQLLDQIDKGV